MPTRRSGTRCTVVWQPREMTRADRKHAQREGPATRVRLAMRDWGSAKGLGAAVGLLAGSLIAAVGGAWWLAAPMAVVALVLGRFVLY